MNDKETKRDDGEVNGSNRLRLDLSGRSLEARIVRMWRRFGVKVLAPVRLAKVDDSG